jgi:hypothetical protein
MQSATAVPMLRTQSAEVAKSPPSVKGLIPSAGDERRLPARSASAADTLAAFRVRARRGAPAEPERPVRCWPPINRPTTSAYLIMTPRLSNANEV